MWRMKVLGGVRQKFHLRCGSKKLMFFVSPQEFKVLETQPINLIPVTVTQYLQGPITLTHSWVLGTVKLTSPGD